MQLAKSTADPFVFSDHPAYPSGNQRVTSKVRRDPRLIAGDKTGVYVVLGQSNAANCTNFGYNAANANKIDCLNIYDGGTYEGTNPLLGCSSLDNDHVSTSNMFVRLADKLIAADIHRRVILIPIAINGSSVQAWASPSGFRDRLRVACRRANALDLPITGFLWQQGEADTVNGTSQTDYAAALQSLISYVRDLSWDVDHFSFPAPWFIARSSYYLGQTSAAVIAGQNAVVNGIDVFAGPNTDVILSGGRQDNAHWNSIGSDQASELWKNSIGAVFS